MLSRLATFLHANGRRVVFAAVVAAAVAGAFGASVAKHMRPYGADDPETQSVQATHRFEHGAGRQIDPGVVALVQPGEVRSSAAKTRVDQGGDRPRAHGPDSDRGGAAVRSRDRRVCHLEGRVHQGARDRQRAGGADRRLDRRALLVPSLMGLLGSANWWAPKPLRKVYRRFGWRDDGSPLPAASN